VIKGSIKGNALLVLGSPSYPAATRVYVAGTEVSISSNMVFGSNLYAPNATVSWSSSTDAYGSVFAGNFQGLSPVKIHYDRAIVSTSKSCPGPTSGGDGGTGPACGSCRDCNNQACNGGTCGACTNDSQCCAPLACDNGTCVAPIILR
jgi:hypothetical protein